MSERIKLKGSVGRGVHYLKKLKSLNPNGEQGYKLETSLSFGTIYGNFGIGGHNTPILAIMPAGGPLIKVGEPIEGIDGCVSSINNIPNYGTIITILE